MGKKCFSVWKSRPGQTRQKIYSVSLTPKTIFTILQLHFLMLLFETNFRFGISYCQTLPRLCSSSLLMFMLIGITLWRNITEIEKIFSVGFVRVLFVASSELLCGKFIPTKHRQGLGAWKEGGPHHRERDAGAGAGGSSGQCLWCRTLWYCR